MISTQQQPIFLFSEKDCVWSSSNVSKGKVVPVLNKLSIMPWRRMGKRMYTSTALVGSELSASRPGRFTPGTHCIGGWVDPRAGLDDVEKRKFLTLLGLELRPLGHPAHSQSLYRLHYPGIFPMKERKCLLQSVLNTLSKGCSEQMQPSVVDMFTYCKQESNDTDCQANQLHCLSDLHTQSKPSLIQSNWEER
jgi:hypothetical protein